jgi:hypothetical protein
VNGNTGLYAIPNGTATTANYIVSANSDPTNTSIGVFGVVGGSDARLTSGITGTGTYLPMTFYTGGSERVRVDTSGNVGIGTSSPSSKFDVVGGRSTFSANSENFSVYLRYNSSTSGFYIGSPSADAMAFSASSGAERMRIDSSGNLLVGSTTQPNAGKLAVSFTQASNQGICLQNTSASNSASYVLMINSAGGIAGTIAQTGATTVNYGSGSDYRLKNNVLPMVGALEKVAQLKPCTYNWIADDSVGQGFIAHELQAVVPDCVVGEKDAVNEDGSIKMQMVDTSFLVATLTAAIQEQQALITALTTRITALEAK